VWPKRVARKSHQLAEKSKEFIASGRYFCELTFDSLRSLSFKQHKNAATIRG